MVDKNGYNVLGYFGGTYESAQTDERKEFTRMISFCKRTSNVSYILVYSLERFSRTGDNAIWLSRQLRELGISIISVTQPIDTSNPAGVLQQNILFLFSQYDNDLRRQKSMAGTKEKLEQGIWCTKPPLGYDTVRRNGERFIEINETGLLIRKAFLWKATEEIPNMEIIKRLQLKGFDVSLKKLLQIFLNPFYCGLISHRCLDGKVVVGKHEPLISQQVFIKVNGLKLEKCMRSKDFEHIDHIPLKQFFKCEVCGENMRGYIVKRKGIYYYKCENKKSCSCNKNAKVLNQRFMDILGELTLDESYLELFRMQLNMLYETINEERETVNTEVRQKTKELAEKLEKLDERYAIGEIESDLYKRMKAKFMKERNECDELARPFSFSTANLENYVNRSIEIVSKLPSMWDSSDFTRKQELQKLIFPEGIYYNKKNDQTRTTKINSLFCLIVGQECISEEKKKGLSYEFKLKSLSVPGNGVEPSLALLRTGF